jgi:Domain of unknown function DUF11
MSSGLTRMRLLLLGMFCALVPCACSGITQNPSYFPSLLPFGDIVPTHARPPGKGYFTNFDPHAVKLVVRPLDSCSPARQQHVLLATIYDEKGQPRRRRRVEWIVEGAGNIVEVDESGYFAGRGYKLDNKYAVSYTDYFEHRITRGTDNPNDDFMVRPGQSWCVITSALEGDTHVTVYAPEIADWRQRKVTVTHHWVNAQWTPPPAASCPAGTQHVFTTNIFRPTDNQPLANYRVRYRIIDGPPAVLLPARTREFVAVSDLRGNASVGIVQLTPGSGTNRVAVEIIRAPDPTATSDAGIVVGRMETRVDWLAPAISLNLQGPPTTVVGREAAYTLAVRNTGGLGARALTVRYFVPEGYQYVRSDPAAIVEDNQLVWTLSGLKAGGSRDLKVVFRTSRPELVSNRATVVTAEGLRDERTLTTAVTRPELKLAVKGPEAGTVGVPITYRLLVSNPGTGPVDKVLLRASFDEGLESEARSRKLELPLDAPLEAKTSREIPLILTPTKAGKLAVRVEAAAGSLTDRAEHTVQVQNAKLTLTFAGPHVSIAGRAAKWDLAVANEGQVPLEKVTLRDALPPEMEFVEAWQGGKLSGREVVWDIGRLKPGERRHYQVKLNPAKVSGGAVQRAVVTGEPVLTPGGAPAAALAVRAEDQVSVEIRGLPAFKVNVTDRDDPLELGARTVYTIEVTNQGSLRGSEVQVVATLPAQMLFERAAGPAPYKVEGQQVTFAPLDGPEPGKTWTYTVEVSALKAGDARFQAELRSATLSEPVIVQQSTTIFSSAGAR